MRKLLQEISIIPGVTGACIFDKKEGALCKDLHSSLSEDILQTVGIHLVRLIQMGTMSGLYVKSTHFRFDKYTVVGMPLDTGTVLITVCESQANCSLIATTAAMLASDMRDDLAKGISRLDEKDDEEQAVVLEQIPELDEKTATELQSFYDKIEDALATSIGPVAGIVMQDYISKWRQNGPEITTRLSELVTMLAQEIGDPEIAQKFSRKIEKIM